MTATSSLTTATPSRALADWIVGFRYEDLPGPIGERIKDLLLDALASALAGRHGDETGQIRAVAQALGASDEATVIGGQPLSLAGATLLNGYLITAVTVCDVHRATLCHTTPEVVPPALAIAERDGRSGRDLLLALALGLETLTRVGVGTNYPAFRARGWHAPGVVGPFGGAAAVGKLRGLSAKHQLAAFGLAGSQSAGTFAQWGTPTVKFHQARGALSGLLAALLAEQGFRSSDEILTHPDGGLYNTYSDGGDPRGLVADLGARWELEQIALRPWPLGSSLQTLATALFALIEAHDLRPERVARIRVGLSETVYRMHGALGWEDRFRALLSTRYATAVILHDRQCWLGQFSPERIKDPALDSFARERVLVEPDSSLTDTATLVEVQTVDGATLVDRRQAPKGDPSDPLTRPEIEAKLRLAGEGLLAPAQAERLITLVGDLEQLPDVRELTALLRLG